MVHLLISCIGIYIINDSDEIQIGIYEKYRVNFLHPIKSKGRGQYMGNIYIYIYMGKMHVFIHCKVDCLLEVIL